MADRWVAWFEVLLCLLDDKLGEDFELMPFWKQTIRDIFGWKRCDNLRRKIRNVFIYVPRGNAKSPVCGGIALGMITIDGEKGAQVYLQSTTAEKANIMFTMIWTMIEQSKIRAEERGQPELDLTPHYRKGKTKDNLDYIEHIASRSRLIMMSGKPISGTGKKPHGAFIDEFQEQKSFGNVTVWRTGMQKRKQPILFMVGTAGKGGEGGTEPWQRELAKAKRVLDNPNSQPNYYAVIFEASKDDDPHDPDVWERVNPGWGYSIDPFSFQQAHDDAASAGGEQWNEFLQYNLNLKVPATSAYIPLRLWDECYDPDLVVANLFGKECFAGLDIGRVDDLSALGIVFPEWRPELLHMPGEAEPRTVNVLYTVELCYYFACQAAIDASRNVWDYAPHVDAGWIEKIGEEMIDMEALRVRVAQILSPFKVIEEGIDKYQMGEMTKYQAAPKPKGDGLTVIPVSQGAGSLSAPTKGRRELVKGRRVRHNGNPVMRFNLENSRVIADGNGNIRLAKVLVDGKISTPMKIDGCSATNNAYRCLLDKEPPKLSVYEKRGLFSI